MTVRDLESRLNQDVRDKILQRLGYREFRVTPPNGTPIEPRPEVMQLDQTSYTQGSAIERILNNLGESRPTAVFKVTIPRVVPKEIMTEFGTWELRHDEDETPVTCTLGGLTLRDGDWIAYLVVQRETNDALIP